MADRWMADVAVVDLVEAERNAKAHNEALIDASLDRFGYIEPIVLDERTGRIISGHGRRERLLAAQTAGDPPPEGVSVDAEGRWVVKVVRGWASPDDTEAEAAGIALNRIGEAGGWHKDVLAEMLGDLSMMGIPDGGLVGVGYGPDDLSDLLAGLAADAARPDDLSDLLAGLAADAAAASATERRTDPDDVPDPPSPTTVTGNVWLLGPHRLICGDATEDADLATLMGGVQAKMLWTDPPYGVSYAAKNEYLNSISRGNLIQVPIEGDHMTPDDMSALWTSAFTNIRSRLAPGASYYVTGPQGGDLLLLLLALRDCGFPLRHMIIWAKNQFVLGRSDYNYKHEPMIYGWVEGAHTFLGGGGESSVWEIDKPHASKLHPTMKPVELIARSIRNSLPRGQVVLDPFGGSGSTIIAAHQEARVAYSSELSPGYCDVICRRFQEHTGIKPVLESTGEPVDFEVAALP